ncbi:alpha/beta fold hydrolase [Bacillus solimangrovi]|uniref:AB hydrolase-1 domain-containing protein n=1 Tax=Bacillus solimangrovi TaxID=1305675 RepID=A0A1E5LF96_9BACI|nr:alpha/beta hydrolase [Bacillus solimangrovi]OEH92740.1 hypothetical protein BFG57_01690 [Bacillus solimangrovi]
MQVINSEGEFISVKGIDIHYHYFQHADQKRPTLVLLHGFLSSLFSFRKLIPLIKEHYSVLALDWPPFGLSGKVKNFTYRTDYIAAVIVEMFELLSIEKFVLVGHSMGGQVALKIASIKQEKCQSLILIAGSGYMTKFPRKIKTATYIPFFPFILKGYLQKKGVRGNLNDVVYNKKMIDDEMVKGYEEPFMKRGMLTGMTRFLRHREDDLSSKQLQNIHVPTLLIYGEQDEIIPVKIGQRLANDLPYSTLKLLPKTGHLIPEERAEDTFKLIHEYLASITIASQ